MCDKCKYIIELENRIKELEKDKKCRICGKTSEVNKKSNVCKHCASMIFC